MRRIPPRGEPPERRPRRDLPRPEGPFDRLLRRRSERDPAPFIIGGTIAFLALVIVLVFVFSSVLGGDDGGQEEIAGLPQGITGRLGDLPGLLPGLVAVSDFVEFETEGELSAVIELPLDERLGDATGLGFYTFLDKRPQKVADVRLVDGGVRGAAEFSPVPGNLVILKVVEQVYQVAGSLPVGGSLHRDARVDILSPRDYTPAADGSVQGTATDVRAGPGVLLMPTIVGSGRGTAAVVDGILAVESLRTQHIEAIVALAEEGGFGGIDLEYSAVEPELGSAFTEFVSGLAEALHQGGMRLSLTLPPQTGQGQAYDWEVLGEAVDTIKVLPIADPVGYWETMPDALSQIVQDVDPRKVMLVVSPFSVERTRGGTQTIGYLEAMLLAGEAAVRDPQDPEQIEPGVMVRLVAANLDEGEGASTLRWSDDAAVVTFAFGGVESRTVFLENVFSVRFKLELVQAYGLAGVAVSDASGQSDVANIWPAVNELVAAATVTLVRPNEDALLPRWQAPDGGDLGAGEGTTVTWIAPSEEGTYTILLIVSDGENRFGQETTVEVGPPLEPSPTPLVTFPPGTPTPTPTSTPTGSPGPSPTPSPALTPTPAPEPTVAVEVRKSADGSDPDAEFSKSEETTAGLPVTYLITIDNDSNVPVTIVSLVDDVYGPITLCLDGSGVSVVGQQLAADNGDGAGSLDGGPDQVQCTFTAVAPAELGQALTDVITVVVQDVEGNEATAQDVATITTI